MNSNWVSLRLLSGASTPLRRDLFAVLLVFSAAVVAGLAVAISPNLIIFIGAVLCLGVAVIAVSRSVCVSSPAGLAILLTAALLAGSREFAHFGVPLGTELTLYITEAVLGVLLIHIIRSVLLDKSSSFLNNPYLGRLGIYWVFGVVALLRGVGTFATEAVRDAALVYYSLFFILFYEHSSDRNALRFLARATYAATLVATFTMLLRLLFGPLGTLWVYNLPRYGTGSLAIAAGLGFLYGLHNIIYGHTSKSSYAITLIGFCQLVAAVFLTQHRSIFLAIVVTTILTLLLGPAMRHRLAAFAVLFFACLILLLPSLYPSSSVTGITLERLSSIANPRSEVSAEWRLVAWQTLLQRVGEKPIMGFGFGPPIDFAFWTWTDLNIDPHNSYVAIIYRMGLSGLLAFGLLWSTIVIRAVRQLLLMSTLRRDLSLALSAHMMIAIFAGFNVALEGPYMGVPFWASLGVVAYLSWQRKATKEPLRDTTCNTSSGMV
jgi:hypothetical protein